MSLKICKPASVAVCLIFFFSCNSQSTRGGEMKKKETYNTIIVINLKKESDREYVTPFSQYNPLSSFSEEFAKPPVNIIDTTNNHKTTIRVALDKPTYLGLGYSIFYIEPGDSLNMDFETIEATKNVYKDKVVINHGNVFFIRRNWQRGSLLMNYLDSISIPNKTIKTVIQVKKYLSKERLASLIENYVALAYEEFPKLKKDEVTLKNIKARSANLVFQFFMNNSIGLFFSTKDEALKDAIKKCVIDLLQEDCKQGESFIDPVAWDKYRAIYYFYKEMNLDGDSIQKKFNNCNDTIKQFVLLNLYKDRLLNNITESEINKRFTYPAFKEVAFKISENHNIGPEKTGYINNNIRSAKVFDINSNELFFGDIFKITNQPYVLFDFCGSWCKPCIDEMASYTKTRHLDNSKKVRPIWLFFENDKTKWTAVVEKYKLKKENCYVIESKSAQDLEKEFALLFDWGGEFPHHFLFTKEGKVINKKAESLSLITDLDIPSSKTSNSSLPPPPPSK